MNVNIRVLTTTGDIYSRTIEVPDLHGMTARCATVAHALTPDPIAHVEVHGEPIIDHPAEAPRSGCLHTWVAVSPAEDAAAHRLAGLTYGYGYLPSSKIG